MKYIGTASLGIAIGLLSACSDAATHPVCQDEATTTAYGVKWQEDLGAAKQAGKLTMNQVVELQGKAYEKLGMLKNKDWTGWCTYIDGVRSDSGF